MRSAEQHPLITCSPHSRATAAVRMKRVEGQKGLRLPGVCLPSEADAFQTQLAHGSRSVGHADDVPLWGARLPRPGAGEDCHGHSMWTSGLTWPGLPASRGARAGHLAFPRHTGPIYQMRGARLCPGVARGAAGSSRWARDLPVLHWTPRLPLTPPAPAG